MSTKNVLYLAAKTNVGRVRELNEDNFITTTNLTDLDWYLPKEPYNNSLTGSIMAIADGMGGANAGEIASKVAIDSVKKYFNFLDAKTFEDKNVTSILKDAILYAHRAILNYSSDKPETEGMGTTLIIGWIINEKLYVGWSGDSRCYLFRSKTGLNQVSKDHSFVQSLIDEEKITKAQAFYHPQANIITQSLGDPERSPVPDTVIINLAKDDLILLCSDGLNGMIMDEQIEQILSEKAENINSCIDMLIDRANEAGGLDNITIVVAKVVEGTNEAQVPDRQVTGDVLNDFSVKQSLTGETGKKKSNFLLSGILLVFFLAAGVVAWFGFFKQSDKQAIPSVVVKDSALHNPGSKNVNIVTTKKTEKDKEQKVMDSKKQKDDTFNKFLQTNKPNRDERLNEIKKKSDTTLNKEEVTEKNLERNRIQKIAEPKPATLNKEEVTEKNLERNRIQKIGEPKPEKKRISKDSLNQINKAEPELKRIQAIVKKTGKKA